MKAVRNYEKNFISRGLQSNKYAVKRIIASCFERVVATFPKHSDRRSLAN